MNDERQEELASLYAFGLLAGALGHLAHGDVVVWGGVDRLRYHGVLPVRPGAWPHRTNLTFRRAG